MSKTLVKLEYSTDILNLLPIRGNNDLLIYLSICMRERDKSINATKVSQLLEKQGIFTIENILLESIHDIVLTIIDDIERRLKKVNFKPLSIAYINKEVLYLEVKEV